MRLGAHIMRKCVKCSLAGKTVCEEVRSILSPLPFSPRLGSASSSMLERRPKRKGKSRLAEEKYRCYSDTPKGRRPAPKFQKKLVVIDCMIPNPPRSFSLKAMHVLMRGMLPEIEMSAGEREVRGYICDTIKNSEKSLSSCGPSDFEYLEASGKCLCVPAQQASFSWTGRAVKQLAGTGAVYVRLTIEHEEDEGSYSSDSDSLPDVKIIKEEHFGKFVVVLIGVFWRWCV